jgi:hypothetical protein
MWIFTRYGFFSIAAAKTRKGTNSSRTVMVRARQRRHLKNLVRRFPTLDVYALTHSSETDYRHRMVLPKSVWMKVVVGMAQEQTWSNFKGEAEAFLGPAFDDYLRALHRVWSVMGDLQTNEPILLTREMLEGIRDFCLVRMRQMEESPSDELFGPGRNISGCPTGPPTSHIRLRTTGTAGRTRWRSLKYRKNIRRFFNRRQQRAKKCRHLGCAPP